MKDLTFVLANGQKITRCVGFAIIRVEQCFTVDEVVFAEKGDLILLGARTLEGLASWWTREIRNWRLPDRCPPRASVDAASSHQDFRGASSHKGKNIVSNYAD